MDPRVWSAADAVWVLVHYECNGFATSYPCSEPDGAGATLYRNDGTGWVSASDATGNIAAAGDFARGLTGFATGQAVLWGGTCPVDLVSADGKHQCVWTSPDFVQDAAIAGDRLFVLFGDAGSTAPQTLRMYDGSAWTILGTAVGASAIAAQGDTVVAVGASQVALVGTTTATALVPLPRVPAGDYLAAWVYGRSDIVLANGLGQLVRYDGTTWKVTDTGIGQPIEGVWGAPDGTVYFISQSRFGRMQSGRVEFFGTGATTSYYFTDISGTTSSEVFVTVNDRNFGVYQCGATFALWFDGTLFHEF
jgi:hypothetical protein